MSGLIKQKDGSRQCVTVTFEFRLTFANRETGREEYPPRYGREYKHRYRNFEEGLDFYKKIMDTFKGSKIKPKLTVTKVIKTINRMKAKEDIIDKLNEEA